MALSKVCSACGYKTNKDAITLLRDGEQWWCFSNYKTKQGNTYSGLHCPDCSDKIYFQNNA